MAQTMHNGKDCAPLEVGVDNVVCNLLSARVDAANC